MSRKSDNIYRRLRGKFNDNILREIVLASEGLKIARTCLTDPDLDELIAAALPNGLHVVASEEKYVHRLDEGKGGWSNSIAATVGSDDPNGLRNVYISLERWSGQDAMHYEESSRQHEFGRSLGIPECCIDAYMRGHPAAAAGQNDFVPIVLANTQESAPYDYWNNYVAQYFGRSLLSFFPCSFVCKEAAKVAQTTFAVLAEVDRRWAERFSKAHRSNILYTEYSGLHQFEEQYDNGWIAYDAKRCRSTEHTSLATLLREGDRLRVVSKNEVEIYKGTQLISELLGPDVAMCVFH